VSEVLFVGTISSIMSSISASQGRNASGEVGQNAQRSLLSEEHFRRVLWAEKKRSERLSKHMILMQVSSDSGEDDCSSVLSRVGTALGSVIRETDVAGWMEANYSLGVVFTELGDCEDVRHAEQIIRQRIAGFLEARTNSEESQVQISFRSFCEEWTERSSAPSAVATAKPAVLPRKLTVETYPDLVGRPSQKAEQRV